MKWPAGLLVVALAAGCGALRPALEVPPGHRVVVGRVDLRGLDSPEGILEIARDDGTFDHALAAGPGVTEFAFALPPGRYRVVRLRPIRSGPGTASHPVRELAGVRFVVGVDPAVYIGTFRFDSGFGSALRLTVADEYDATLYVLRARHPGLPDPVGRAPATTE